MSALTPPSRGDLVAGVTVALVLVPQALAYADLAGVPPVHGVYAAAMAPLFGALAGSSPYLQTGPVAMTSLLTFGALVHLAPTGTEEFAAYAALLALVVGVTRLLVGLVGAGTVAYLMSQPVVVAFTVAGALLIIGSQVPTLLAVPAGADGPVTSDNPAVGALQALADPGAWDLAALAVGSATIALVLAGRWLGPRVPMVLVVTVGAVLLSRAGAVDVPTVGAVPAGPPPLTPDLPWGSLPQLVVPGIVIALVGFAEAAAISRRYAAADRRRWDPDREFVGQGLANLGAGLFSGYPAGGSFSRSALARLSGATSRWSGLVTGAVVLATLPVLSVLSDLPRTVLAGFVIAAVVGLVEVRPFVELARFSRPQLVVGLATFAATLALAPRVEQGVVVGVALALAVHLWRELRVHVETWLDGDTLHVRPSGVLYFGSAPAVEGRVLALLAEHAEVDHLVVHLDRLGRVDLSGVLVLRTLREEAAEAHVDVAFADVPRHAGHLLGRVLGDAPGDGRGPGGPGGPRGPGDGDGRPDGPVPPVST